MQTGFDGAATLAADCFANESIENLKKPAAISQSGCLWITVVRHQQGNASGCSSRLPQALDLIHEVVQPDRLKLKCKLAACHAS